MHKKETAELYFMHKGEVNIMTEKNNTDRKLLDAEAQELIARAEPMDKLLMLYAARNLKLGAEIEDEKRAR